MNVLARRLLEFKLVANRCGENLLSTRHRSDTPSCARRWWSRIQHPLFPSTRQCKTFVNACEKSTPGSEADQDLREQQWQEMKRVVRWVVDNKA